MDSDLPVGEPVLKVVVKEGDSLWKILETTLGRDVVFNASTEADKIFVLSNLSKEILSNTKSFGLNQDGTAVIGSILDLSPILLPQSKVQDLLKKASTIGEEEKKNLVGLKKRASDAFFYIPETSKPEIKVEIKPEVKTEIKPEEPKAPMTLQSMVDKIPVDLSDKLSVPEKTQEKKQENTQEKIQDKNLVEPKMPVTPSNQSGEEVDKAFENGINDIYKEKGFVGFGGKPGTLSQDWQFIKILPASEVVSFYSSDSSGSNLRPEVKAILSKSEKHLNLARQMQGMMRETNDTVKPYQNENVSDFLKRLIGFVLRNVKN